jgi:hypothetical protein
MSEKMFSLEELRAVIVSMAKPLSNFDVKLPTFGYSEDNSFPHIEVGFMCYQWISKERGKENLHLEFKKTNDILFQVFEFITSEIARNWELENRVDNEDFRRQFFAKQVELMYNVSSEFGDRMNNEINELLLRSPYDDASSYFYSKSYLKRFTNLKQ